jgi:hypothetical protein
MRDGVIRMDDLPPIWRRTLYAKLKKSELR